MRFSLDFCMSWLSSARSFGAIDHILSDSANCLRLPYLFSLSNPSLLYSSCLCLLSKKKSGKAIFLYAWGLSRPQCRFYKQPTACRTIFILFGNKVTEAKINSLNMASYGSMRNYFKFDFLMLFFFKNRLRDLAQDWQLVLPFHRKCMARFSHIDKN